MCIVTPARGKWGHLSPEGLQGPDGATSKISPRGVIWLPKASQQPGFVLLTSPYHKVGDF